MFNSILLAVDGSDYSSHAVPTAIEVAQKFQAKVFVLHVHEHDRGRAAAFTMETDDKAAQIVADAVKSIRAAGITGEGEVRDAFLGQVASEIVETAAIQGADLIVMGSRGLSDVAGLFLGSVTHQVIKLAKVTVLVERSASPVEPATAAAGRTTIA